MTREQLTRYLDNLDRPITSDNIGKIRRDLMMPFDCEWNAWVRDETAAREKHIPEPGESSGFHEFRIKVLQNTVKSLNEQIAGLRQELATAHGVVQIRDKRIEELESCGLVMDFADQSRELEALRKYDKDRELQYKTACSDRDTAQSQLAARDREILLLQRHVQDLAERNMNLRTAKVTAENELRRIKTNPVLLNYLPREITALNKFCYRAREMALDQCPGQFPGMREFWNEWGSRNRDFAKSLILRIFELLPQLDVQTTRHPSGSSEPGDRNSVDPLSGRQSNSENGQTSIASEDR